jgi:transcriptional regulator with XRE-family HTH domain
MNGVIFNGLLTTIGNKLTELRKQKGYSSHESFAFDYDLARVQYWRLEKGKSNFTIKTLIKVLEIHNISLDEFFASLNHVTPLGNNGKQNHDGM